MALGVLNELDREKLAFMVQALDEAYDLNVRVIQLRKNDELDERDEDGYRVKDGMVVYSTKGFPMPNPLIALRDKAEARFSKYASEFGMSPADRAALLKGDGKAPEADELSMFLAKGYGDRKKA